MINKVSEKILLQDLLIDEIDRKATNDWDELCNACSSLIRKAKMTDEDIDTIVKKVQNGSV